MIDSRPTEVLQLFAISHNGRGNQKGNKKRRKQIHFFIKVGSKHLKLRLRTSLRIEPRANRKQNQAKKKKNGKDSPPNDRGASTQTYSFFPLFLLRKPQKLVPQRGNQRDGRKKVHPAIPRVHPKQTTSVYNIQRRTTAHVRGEEKNSKRKKETHTWSIQIQFQWRG